MTEIETPADAQALIGKLLGIGDWLLIDQQRIDRFAEATGDDQWIHIDPARAKAELAGGVTIAHGYLTLSLLPILSRTTFRITRRSRGVNYGSDKVRFITPVAVGSRIRLRQTLLGAETVSGGQRLTFESIVEIEHCTRPALIAHNISIAYD